MRRHNYVDKKEPQGYKNLKSGNDTYEKRRKIIDVIYEAKKLLKTVGIDLPRIEVRIVDVDPNQVMAEHLTNALGIASVGGNQIWIPEKSLTGKYVNFLKDIVFHEILHAGFGIGHDSTSKLMQPHINISPLPDSVRNELFINHIKNKLKIK